jgi:hypothetical protein
MRVPRGGLMPMVEMVVVGDNGSHCGDVATNEHTKDQTTVLPLFGPFFWCSRW